jgi:hypothetical protein
MSAAALQSGAWPGQRWGALILIVLATQLALVFSLSDRRPHPVRPPAAAPTLRLANGASAEWLALQDPTLFALPNERSFAGQAWMEPPPAPSVPLTWTEPPRWLPVPTEQLGLDLAPPAPALKEGPGLNPLQLAPAPAAGAPEPVAALTGSSTFRLRDGLAGRRLRTPLLLPTQPAAELLSPTVVQLVVDADGFPVSAIVLRGSGSATADGFALERARLLRFEPLRADPAQSPLAQLSWGEVVFLWQTVPVAATNTPAPAP